MKIARAVVGEIKLVFSLLIITFSLHVYADQIAVRDEARINVPRSLFGSKPSNEIKAQVRTKAIDNAWGRYQAQNVSTARAAIFKDNEVEFRKLAEQVCNFNFYDENYDKENQEFSIKVRGTCDQNAIDAAFNKLSSAKSQAAGGDKKGFTFVFLARRAADSTLFVDKVTNTTKFTVSTTGDELVSEASAGNSSSSSSVSQDGASVTQAATTQSKGLIEKRDTIYKFKVEQSEGVDNAVTNVLATAGFEVSKYSDVIAECPGVTLDEIVVNFASPKPDQAELVSPELRRKMISSARECGMSYFAIGIVDILKSEQMPDGNVRVTVALTIDVRDITKKVAYAVAAIPSAQFQALGRDRIEAANVALKLAAEKGTREIVDMLRQRNIN